jgi:hypothetical protein
LAKSLSPTNTKQANKPLNETNDCNLEYIRLSVALHKLREVEELIKQEFGEVAVLEQILSGIRELSDSTEVPLSFRLKAMQAIQNAAAVEELKLEPRIPDIAPSLWADNPNKDEHPFVFAYRVYGDAAHIMVVSDYAKLDPQLGHKLDYYKRTGKEIPAGYYIKTKKERDNELIATTPSWKEFVESLPYHLRIQARALKAAESRRKRSPKAP